MEEPSIRCSRCGKKHPPGKIKYFQDAKNMLCLECIDKIRIPASFKIEPIDQRKKIRYKCQKCKHVLLIKESFPKQCTFCGGQNLVLQGWNSDLDSLINESTKSEYDL